MIILLFHLLILIISFDEYIFTKGWTIQSYNDKQFNINFTKKLKNQQLSHTQIKEIITDAIYSIDNKHDLDTKTFTAAIQTCNQHEEFTTALEIFHLMNKTTKHIIPDRITYGVAMTSCMHLGYEYEAKQLFNHCDKKYKLGSSKKYFDEDIAIFSLMIATYDGTGSWVEVLNTFDHLNSIYGLKPTSSIINSALRATKRLGNWDKYDDIMASLAILDNVMPSKSSKVINSKTLSQCLTYLNQATSADDISTAIAQVSAENPDSEHVIDKLIAKLDAILSTDALAMRLIANESRLRRRIQRLLQKLRIGPLIEDLELIQPSIDVYNTLIRGSGLRNNSELAFKLFNNALSKLSSINRNDTKHYHSISINHIIDNVDDLSSIDKKRTLYRSLVEACVQANDQLLLLKARLLIEHEYGTLSSKNDGRTIAYGIVPTAYFAFNGKDYSIRNGNGEFSNTTRNLISMLLRTKSRFYNKINIKALPEQGMNIPITHAKEMLSLHCEKQALSGILQLNTYARTPLTKQSLNVNVNLCMCSDCHSFFKATSNKLQLEIQCKDPSRIHLFQIDGTCSCKDHWGGR